MPAVEPRAPSEQPNRALTTSVEALRSAAVVHVVGEIDISTVSDLEIAVHEAERRAGDGGAGGAVIVIDLRGVTFLGAEGLRSLVSAQNRLAEKGAAMRVVAPPEGGMIRRLLDLSGVASLLDLFETIESEVSPDKL